MTYADDSLARLDLRESLATLRWPRERDGYAYRGAADFVLRHGSFFQPVSVPKPALNAACYGNAIIVADLLGWRYIEGYALGPRSTVPIHHAWVADTDGVSYELTWLTAGRAYLGVEFSPLRADDATWNGDATVLDDRVRHWPLLRLPWTGEEADATFGELSPPLVTARAIDPVVAVSEVLSRLGLSLAARGPRT